MSAMFGHEEDVNLPELLTHPLHEYLDVYELWTIWQAVERKPTEFLAALKIPKKLLNLFMEMDTRATIMGRAYWKYKQDLKK